MSLLGHCPQGRVIHTLLEGEEEVILEACLVSFHSVLASPRLYDSVFGTLDSFTTLLSRFVKQRKRKVNTSKMPDMYAFTDITAIHISGLGKQILHDKRKQRRSRNINRNCATISY